MTTYYLRQGGTAANKAAATGPGYDAAACMSVTVHNGETFSADDIIMLCDDGGNIRGQITPPSSGSSDSPITYRAESGDSPIVSGADVILGWTNDGGNVWYAALITVPNVVFFDDVHGVKKADKVSLASNNDWFHSGGENRLYVYRDDGDPDTSGVLIEAGQRDYCVGDGGAARAYITIDGIQVEKSNYSWGGAIDARGDGGNWVIQNCIITLTGHIGIMMLDDSPLIDNNIFSYTGSAAIHIHENSINGTISNNIIGYASCYIKGSGVTLKGDSYIMEYNEISYSTYNGLYLEGRPSQGSSADNNIIRYNAIHDNGQGPTWADITNGAAIYNAGGNSNEYYYNLIYGAAPDHAVGMWLDFGSDSNEIYNNVVYGMQSTNQGYGITIEDGAEGGESENNIIKNNIVSNCTTQLAVADDIAADLQGNVFDYNCYYVGTGTRAVWYLGNMTLAEWQAIAAAPDAHSIDSDPLFMDVTNDNFVLQSISPCRDAGEDVGLDRDFDGNTVPRGSGPDMGAHELFRGVMGLTMLRAISPIYQIGWHGWRGRF